MILLSGSGMLRTILILLIVWQVLRLWMRMQEQPRSGNTHRVPHDGRSRGEVRIERPLQGRSTGDVGPVEDADFEEIK